MPRRAEKTEKIPHERKDFRKFMLSNINALQSSQTKENIADRSSETYWGQERQTVSIAEFQGICQAPY